MPYWDGYGYGYMWWANVDETDRKYGMYAALGYGGHMIAVLPQDDLVIVNRTNTYLGETASSADLLRLIDAILDAKVSPPKAEPKLVPLEVAPKDTEVQRDSSIRLEDYAGSFEFDSEEVFVESIPYVIGDMIGPSVRIEAEGRRMLMIDNLGQKFVLVPRTRTEFLIEDMEIPVIFEIDEKGRPLGITLDASPAWKIAGRRAAGKPTQ